MGGDFDEDSIESVDTLNILYHSLLACQVSADKSPANLWVLSSKLRTFFF